MNVVHVLRLPISISPYLIQIQTRIETYVRHVDSISCLLKVLEERWIKTSSVNTRRIEDKHFCTHPKKGRRRTKKDIILSQNPSDPEKRWFVQRENLRNKIKIKIILRGWSISFIILPSCMSPQQQQKKRDLNLFLKNHKSIVSLSLLFVHFMNEWMGHKEKA